MTPAQLNLRIDFSANLEAGRLYVAYSITNTTGSEIGMFNRIPSVNPDGSLNFAPGTVYADIEDSVLHLKKMVLPIPRGLSVAVRSVPGVTRLAPGDTGGEQFILGLPIPANNPYTRAMLVAQTPDAYIIAAQPVNTDSVMLSIGVFPVTPDLRFELFSPAWPDVFMPVPPGIAVAAQSIVSASVRLPAPIPVLDYAVVARQ